MHVADVYDDALTGAAFQIAAGFDIILADPMRVSLQWRYVGMFGEDVESWFNQLGLSFRYLF